MTALPLMVASPARPEWHRDNPITWESDREVVNSWLADNPYTPTARFTRLMVSVARLRELPGRRGEHLLESNPTEQAITDRLASSMQLNGYVGGAVLVCVEQDGAPYIYEGNHRIRAAALIGLEAIPADVRYLGGSEMRPHVWTPDAEPLPL